MTGLTKSYRIFFGSEGGKHLLESINKLILSQYQTAENDAEHTRDYIQRAKGMREVLTHINSVKGGVKKSKVTTP